MTAGELKKILENAPDGAEVATMDVYNDTIYDRRKAIDAYHVYGTLDGELTNTVVIGYER